MTASLAISDARGFLHHAAGHYQVGATDEGSFRDRTKRNFVCSEQSSYDESLRFVGSYEIRPVSSNRFEVSATLEILP
jgi:hypothetical protein